MTEAVFRLKQHLTSFQIMILGFAGVILLGALVLMLPIATVQRVWTPFHEALFTSTSAVCVTGLVVQDTGSYWSAFGQTVILLLIQIGGLGVITGAVTFLMLAGRNITLKERSAMQDAISAPAVGGIVRISNDVELENGRVKHYRLPRSILAFMQVLEYDRSFLASRILFDRFNGSLIISGAFGLFKKDTVIAVGGYDNKTMGEDMELVVKLHEYCTINGIDYAIRYATDAICWTQVPERLRDLCKQRKRWHLGLFQSMYKHRVMFSNHRFGAVSFVSYLYFLIYELLSPFIEVFGVFTMVLAWWCDLINIPFMLLFFLIYAVFGSVLTLTAFFSRIYTADLSVSFRDGVKAVCLCLFELVFLRFILAWVRCTAFVGYRKKKLSWGRIERRKIDLK